MDGVQKTPVPLFANLKKREKEGKNTKEVPFVT